MTVCNEMQHLLRINNTSTLKSVLEYIQAGRRNVGLPRKRQKYQHPWRWDKPENDLYCVANNNEINSVLESLCFNPAFPNVGFDGVAFPRNVNLCFILQLVYLWCCVWCFRLLSWAGKSIEPYGVDYILQKLGFSHARTTIPKWMQRGFMDPLDKVLAVLMLRMITVVWEEPPAGEGDSNKRQTDRK